jgi:hypothetical protein
MKVFISWSGHRSKAVAHALWQWLPDVIQSIKPWLSAEDIDAGTRWSQILADELAETRFGIICVTPENQNAPWILFEAGALAKTIEKTYVCPYLIEMRHAELRDGPLTQFQTKQADENQTWDLVKTINRALQQDSLPEEKLKRSFEIWCPNLERSLNNLPPSENDHKEKRKPEDMIEEILNLSRDISRRTRPTPSFVDHNKIIAAFSQYVMQKRPSLGSLLTAGQLVYLDDDIMSIGFKRENSFNRTALIDRDNFKSITESAEEFFGKPTQVKIISLD